MKLPWIVFLLPLLLVATSLPLALGKVGKNRLYGYRTAKTLRGSDEQWYRANRVCGLALLAAGILSLLVCAGVGFSSLSREQATAAALGTVVVSIALAAIYTISKT